MSWLFPNKRNGPSPSMKALMDDYNNMHKDLHDTKMQVKDERYKVGLLEGHVRRLESARIAADERADANWKLYEAAQDKLAAALSQAIRDGVSFDCALVFANRRNAALIEEKKVMARGIQDLAEKNQDSESEKAKALEELQALRTQVNETITARDAEVAKLNEEAEQRRRAIGNLGATISDQRADIDDWKRRTGNIVDAADALYTRAKDQKCVIANLNKELDDQRAELLQVEGKLARATRDRSEDGTRHDAEIAALTQQLQQANEKLAATVSQNETNVEALQAQLDDKKKMNHDLTAQVQEKIQSVADLQDQLQFRKELVVRLEGQLSTTELARKEDGERHEEQVADLQQQLKQATEDVAHVWSSLDSANCDRAKLTADADATNFEHAQLLQALHHFACIASDDVNNQLAARDHVITQLLGLQQGLEEQLGFVCQQAEIADEEAAARIASLQQLTEQAAAHLRFLSNDLQAKQSELSQTTTRNQQLTAALASEKASRIQLQRTRDEESAGLQRSIAAKNSELTRYRANTAQLTGRLAAEKTSKAALEQHSAAQAAENSALREMLDGTEAELALFKESLVKAEAQRRREAEANGIVRVELERTNERLATKMQSQEEVKRELQEKREEARMLWKGIEGRDREAREDMAAIAALEAAQRESGAAHRLQRQADRATITSQAEEIAVLKRQLEEALRLAHCTSSTVSHSTVSPSHGASPALSSPSTVDSPVVHTPPQRVEEPTSASKPVEWPGAFNEEMFDFETADVDEEFDSGLIGPVLSWINGGEQEVVNEDFMDQAGGLGLVLGAEDFGPQHASNPQPSPKLLKTHRPNKNSARIWPSTTSLRPLEEIAPIFGPDSGSFSGNTVSDGAIAPPEVNTVVDRPSSTTVVNCDVSYVDEEDEVDDHSALMAAELGRGPSIDKEEDSISSLRVDVDQSQLLATQPPDGLLRADGSFNTNETTRTTQEDNVNDHVGSANAVRHHQPASVRRSVDEVMDVSSSVYGICVELDSTQLLAEAPPPGLDADDSVFFDDEEHRAENLVQARGEMDMRNRMEEGPNTSIHLTTAGTSFLGDEHPLFEPRSGEVSF